MRHYAFFLAIALPALAAILPAQAGLRPADPPRPELLQKVQAYCPPGWHYNPYTRRCAFGYAAMPLWRYCRIARNRFNPRCRGGF